MSNTIQKVDRSSPDYSHLVQPEPATTTNATNASGATWTKTSNNAQRTQERSADHNGKPEVCFGVSLGSSPESHAVGGCYELPFAVPIKM
jgi:hypothetical protein